MSEAQTLAPAPPPGRGFNWRGALLLASLALNLVFIGGGAARFVMHDRPGRMSGISEMQLIPRKFFGDLGAGRRGEMMAVFKGYRDEFRGGRDARRQLALAIADALEVTPFDQARVAQAVAAFTTQSSQLAGRGGEAALDFIAKLDDAERKLLAQRIRERSGSRGKDGRGD